MSAEARDWISLAFSIKNTQCLDLTACLSWINSFVAEFSIPSNSERDKKTEIIRINE